MAKFEHQLSNGQNEHQEPDVAPDAGPIVTLAGIDEATLLLRGSIEVRLEDVLKIIEINRRIITIAEAELLAIKAQLEQVGKGGGVINNINNKLRTLANISNNPQIVSQQAIISEQVVVLFVGALESYLGDVVRTVGNLQPDLFHLSDEHEKISFSQAMLKDGFQLGDAILEHIVNKKYSFQDLKSSIDVFDKYLSIKVALDVENRDILILIAAIRNVVVHKSSKVDRQFLKQIRETVYFKDYKINDNISVSDDILESAKEAILNYADQITAAVINSKEEI